MVPATAIDYSLLFCDYERVSESGIALLRLRLCQGSADTLLVPLHCVTANS